MFIVSSMLNYGSLVSQHICIRRIIIDQDIHDLHVLEVIVVASFGSCACSLAMAFDLFIFLCSLLVLHYLFMESVGYRILMPRKQYDFQDSHVFDDEKFGRLFQVYSLDFSLAFRKVLGKRWLVENAGCFLAEIASRFLTICMNVLLDFAMVRALFDAYFHSYFYTVDDLDSALSFYHFEFGNFEYGGFLSRSQLLSSGWHRELLSIMRNDLISNLYDDTLFAMVALLDHVSPDCLAATVNIFSGIHFLLDSMHVVLSSPTSILPIQMVPPAVLVDVDTPPSSPPLESTSS